MQERRGATRLPVSFDVDLTHPTFGTRRCQASNISEGGLFVRLPAGLLTEGARVTVHAVPVGATTQHTPLVQMQVARSDTGGVGLSFVSRTAEHLWNAAQQALGQGGHSDLLLRVYHAAVVMCDRQMLLVRGDGQWTLPGAFLGPTQAVDEHVAELVLQQTALAVSATTPMLVASLPGSTPQYRVYLRGEATTSAPVVLAAGWHEHRWLRHAADLDPLPVADGHIHQLARQLLGSHRGGRRRR